MSGLLQKMNQILDPPLKRKMEELQKKMEEATQLLSKGVDNNEEQTRQRMHIFNTASWLEESRKALDEARKSIEDKIGQVYAKGYLWPVLYSRLKVVRAIDDTNKKVSRLLEQGTSLCSGASGGRGCQDLVGDRARASAMTMERHVTTRDEGHAGVARVLGMPGAGKTAVVSTTYESVRVSEKEKRRFTLGVFWARMGTDESDQKLESLQRRIAREMGIDLSLVPIDVKGMASKLRQHFVEIKNKGKFLLVLDLWGNFTFEEIGIPDVFNGEIIVICRTLVAAQVKFERSGSVVVEDFIIELLNEEEARQLFCKIVGVSMPEEVLSKFMAKCDRLPAAVVDLAQVAKEELINNPYNLDHACDEALRRFKGLSAIHTRLKDNYMEMREMIKAPFVYCASMRDDVIEREKLIKLVAYWMWNDAGEVAGVRPYDILLNRTKRGDNILKEIIAVHLLEEVVGHRGEKCIKISKIARLVANLINIPSQDPCYVVNTPCADKTWAKIAKRVSLSSRQLRDLGRQPEFEKITTLMTRKDDEREEPWLLPAKSFFGSMTSIQVLDLSHTRITTLPSSFSNLENLRALLLHHCPNLTRVRSVAKFVKLIVMNLSDTPITRLPEGVENLTQLVRINISRTRIETLPFTEELLKSWVHLKEVLMMSTYLWTGNERLYYFLRKMEKLQVNFLDAQAFYSFVADEGFFPHQFKFCVGHYHTIGQRLPDETLALLGDCDVFTGGSDLLPKKLAELRLMHNKFMTCVQCIKGQSLQNLGVLDIYYCKKLLYVFSLDMLKHVPNIKRISVDRCSRMEYLIKSDECEEDNLQAQSGDDLDVLTKLESLVFIKAKKLVGVYNKGSGIRFKSLRSVAVWKCAGLKELPIMKSESSSMMIDLHGERTWVEEIFSNENIANSYKHVNDIELVTKRSVKVAFSRGRSWTQTIINAIAGSVEIGLGELMHATETKTQ